MSEHYFALGDDFEVVKDNLNYISLSVGLDENLSIRATCLFTPPSKDIPIPEIVVLATLPSHMRQGFGNTALKIALTFMEIHYDEQTVGLWADLFQSDDGSVAVNYW